MYEDYSAILLTTSNRDTFAIVSPCLWVCRSFAADGGVTRLHSVAASNFSHEEGHQEATGLHSRIQDRAQGMLILIRLRCLSLHTIDCLTP